MYSAMSPDRAILLLCVGVLLLYVELNRPGWIIPGAAGVLALLLAIASLAHNGVQMLAVLMCMMAAMMFAVTARTVAPVLLTVAATLTLVLGLCWLTPDAHARVAVPCGIMLGVGTSLLTRIAHRARVNTGLD
jgi:membrane-bound serine protease (ClpP class)